MKRVVLVATLLGLAAPAAAQSYRFPLELGGSGPAPYITAYRDLSGAGGGLRDWNCGSTTYDGHRGTDIGIGGFAAMDAGSRWVVAAAPGTVTVATDGCFDRCTSGRCDCGAGFGNAVRITHADGKSTWYGHLMNGSLQVRNGQSVTCGQRLGRVGSSGNSTGPHLHFEPRYGDNSSDDPYSGSCGGPLSFWVAQGAYRSLPADRCEGGAPPPPPPPPVQGTLRGVVFDSEATAGPGDPGNVRVPGTVIQIEGGPRVTARDGDAYFEIALAPGTYQYEATHEGYSSATRSIAVVAGQDAWGSIGVARETATPPPASDPPPVEPPVGAPDEGPPVVVDGAPLQDVPSDAPPAELSGATEGGCRCVDSSRSGGLAVALLITAGLWIDRRRRTISV